MNTKSTSIPKIILLSGISASGKSSYASYLAKEHGYKIECADTWRKVLDGDASSQKSNRRIFEEILPTKIREHLKNGETVIVDITALTVRDRRSYVEMAKEFAVSIECHYFSPILHQAKEWNKDPVRNRIVPEEILVKQENKFVVPSRTEGFSFIYQVNAQGGNFNATCMLN